MTGITHSGQISLLTKASISLACEFLATVSRILSRDFRTTFVRVSRECRENFLCRELVANWSRSFSTC